MHKSIPQVILYYILRIAHNIRKWHISLSSGSVGLCYLGVVYVFWCSNDRVIIYIVRTRHNFSTTIPAVLKRVGICFHNMIRFREAFLLFSSMMRLVMVVKRYSLWYLYGHHTMRSHFSKWRALLTRYIGRL